jgi:hypothetical protein
MEVDFYGLTASTSRGALKYLKGRKIDTKERTEGAGMDYV